MEVYGLLSSAVALVVGSYFLLDVAFLVVAGNVATVVGHKCHHMNSTMDLHTANQIGRLDQCFLLKDHHTVEIILGIVLIIVHHTKALDLEILIVNSEMLWRGWSTKQWPWLHLMLKSWWSVHHGS
jgi:hypothetical protein